MHKTHSSCDQKESYDPEPELSDGNEKKSDLAEADSDGANMMG